MAINQFSLRVVALAGGVGGAKLAHGLAAVLRPEHLTVIVNTGDDFIHYGLHISPDLDTVMYTLAGIANPITGWGLQHETWQALTMLEQYGEQPWFRLGDRDLGTHLLRTQGLNTGLRLTEITQRMSAALKASATILPMTDDPIATVIETEELGQLEFQHYFVKHRWQPTAIRVIYRGASRAQATPEVLTAMQNADLIVICPSNPILSIEPILQIKEIRNALLDRHVPSVGVSPLIKGKAVKGPTDKLMAELELDASIKGIADYYNGLIDGLVVDNHDANDVHLVKNTFPKLSIYQTQTLMRSMEDRQTLAINLLQWASEATYENMGNSAG